MIKFTVTGRGVFPFDMLRFDSCWPLRPEDSAGLDWSGQPGYRSVTLVSVKDRYQITPERWNSFLWSVDPESIERY